jgi:RNA polymerase sigma-70 factor (ECF subfamily)
MELTAMLFAVGPQDSVARRFCGEYLMAQKDLVGKYSHVPDESLVEKFNNGAREAFVELVHRYQGRIVNFINRTLGDIERSEELAQESFIRAFRKADSFNSKYRFSTWLYTIARNLASNELRDRSRRPTPYTINDEDWAAANQVSHDGRGKSPEDPQRRLLDKEMKQALEKALERLSQEHRMALILKEYEGLTYAEIADILDASAGTVKSWVYRAKREIYKILKEMGVV